MSHTRRPASSELLSLLATHNPLLQVATVRRQTDARYHVRQLRKNDRRSERAHLVHADNAVQTSRDDLRRVLVETAARHLECVGKRLHALVRSLVPELRVQ